MNNSEDGISYSRLVLNQIYQPHAADQAAASQGDSLGAPSLCSFPLLCLLKKMLTMMMRWPTHAYTFMQLGTRDHDGS